MEKQIDIIVPVYNGLEELKKCVESIKKNTDLNRHRLIIVDDKSPDKEVIPYLMTLKSKQIHIIESPVNEGFSASVNKGMQYSDRDVILLNSDTIVTKNWVEKLIACAYSRQAAASVTPLSNAATLCSVPEFLQDNPLPEGYSVEEMGQLVEHCSIRRYPRISVAVGFCMYIKRNVIEEIGCFDAETFGKGYGEENDFCHRAEEKGYIHLMCDDTFIYHKGTASFDSEEKRKLLEDHERILMERHEPLVRRNGMYCQQNPNRDIQENIKLYLQFGKENCGKLYLTDREIVEKPEIYKGNTVFFAVRKEAEVFVTAFTGENRILFHFPAPFLGVYQQNNEEEEENILRDFIKAFRITEVEILGNHNFAKNTISVLKKEILDHTKEYDSKRILRGYLAGKEEYLSENELIDGWYSRNLKKLTSDYVNLQQEDKVKSEELSNIYHSKRFRLACAMEKLVKPFKCLK